MDNIKHFLEADALRTQGEWRSFWAKNGHLYSIIAMHEDGITRTLLASVDELGEQNQPNANFIAAASRIALDIRQLLAAFEQVCAMFDEVKYKASLLRHTKDEAGLAGDFEMIADKGLAAVAPWRKLMGGV